MPHNTRRCCTFYPVLAPKYFPKSEFVTRHRICLCMICVANCFYFRQRRTFWNSPQHHHLVPRSHKFQVQAPSVCLETKVTTFNEDYQQPDMLRTTHTAAADLRVVNRITGLTYRQQIHILLHRRHKPHKGSIWRISGFKELKTLHGILSTRSSASCQAGTSMNQLREHQPPHIQGLLDTQMSLSLEWYGTHLLTSWNQHRRELLIRQCQTFI